LKFFNKHNTQINALKNLAIRLATEQSIHPNYVLENLYYGKFNDLANHNKK